MIHLKNEFCLADMAVIKETDLHQIFNMELIMSSARAAVDSKDATNQDVNFYVNEILSGTVSLQMRLRTHCILTVL